MWRVSEFFASQLARADAADRGDLNPPHPLLFVNGTDRRWIELGPANWVDVRIEVLVELLNLTRPLPVLAWPLGGLSEG